MPTARINRTLAAGEVVANIFDGLDFQFIGQRPARVLIWGVQDTAARAELEVSFTNLRVLQPSQLNVAGVALTGPSQQNDGIVDAVAPPGSQLIGRVRNTDGANPSVIRLLIDVS